MPSSAESVSATASKVSAQLSCYVPSTVLKEEREVKPMENRIMETAPLEIFTAAQVEPKEIKWLWYPYIPFGKLTMIIGDSGDGKSTFALNLAAILTRGDTLPFTEASNGPMNVIYINAEDDADDTVVPRFMKGEKAASHIFG